ncbi:suppressor of tub2 mutation [Coemansia sp. BCRC 34301]|nr:suppressor of tub2 mutation [Coemansia sp. BCRC 34301]
MSETLDQVLRALQGAQSQGLESKVAVLDRLAAILAQGASGSVIACQAALACVQPLVEYVAREANMQAIRSLLHFVLPPLLDRLGDGRMAVRELTLATLGCMWAELQAMHSRKSSLETTPSPTRPNGSRYNSIASAIPRFTTPFKSHILKPRVPASPSAGQWNPTLVFEREMQARGFGHKIWRVREMVLEWLNSCVGDYPDFPASHYVGNAFMLLDDSQDAVRFASKRVLNTIYHSRTELQQDIVSRAQALGTSRQTLLSAITAPAGELAAMPSSPYGNARSGSRLGAGSARPGSRIAGPRSDSRIGGPASNGVRTGSHIPQMPSRLPDPSLQAANTVGLPGYRSMSQLGARPGSRAGHSSPLSPGRTSRQQSPMQPPAYPPMPSLPPLSGNGSHQHLSYTGSPTSQLSTASPLLSNRRSSHALNPRNPLLKHVSQQRLPEPFTPRKDVPSGVRAHNVPSKQSLATEFLHTVEAFAGRESEENWIQRERAIILYRGIVWGNAATELGEDLVGHLKDNMLDVFKVVNSLRTSLSASAMCLCEDIAMRLGPQASPLFDTIVDVLVRQCAQTKRISAQRAARSLEVVFHHLPLRAKAVDALRAKMLDKSSILRQAVVTTCTSIMRSHGHQMATFDRRYLDVLVSISEVTSAGVTDAQPLVREAARELFWTLHAVSEVQATKLLATFPDSTRAAITRDKPRYSRESSTGSLHHGSGAERPMPAASTNRSPATPQHRLPALRSGFSVSQASPAVSLMSVVADHSPHRSPTAAHSSRDAATSSSTTPLFSHSGASLAALDNRDCPEEAERSESLAVGERDDIDMDNDDSLVFAERGPGNRLHARVNGLRSPPVQARMSLGLIDFSQMEIGTLLTDVGTPPYRSLLSDQGVAGHNMQASVSELAPTSTREAEEGEKDLAQGRIESQATAVAAEAVSVSLTPSDSSQLLESTQADSDEASSNSHSGKTGLTTGGFCLESALAQDHTLTPDKTPRMSPSPRGEPMQVSPVLKPASRSNFATPRTQTARYWHGPIEPLPLVSAFRQQAAESPMPAETPQRLGKVERHLQHLASNDDVDEALFRSLARFAKEESSNVWVATAKGGSGYLDRILQACLGWLQNPAESRDTVFAKDSCFDVLRVLVRRKSQHFSLDTSRQLLLEVLRNKFFESTILSGSAEDVFYDMARHLDANLCFELAEDFFKRALLPPVQCLAAQRPGYAAQLVTQIQTPPEMDPLGVFAMDNALAGVLDFVAEVARRLPSPDAITMRELDQFMPYAVVCFIHPRSQVRKAALTPMIAVHEKMGVPDTELEELLLRASPEELAASPNPLARYIDMLHRPELRRLAWTYYLSKRDT